MFFFFKQKTAYEMRISDWSSDVCSSDLATNVIAHPLVTGIAQLGFDHQAFLGDSAEGIAAEKAGIAKPGVPLVTMRYAEGVARRIAAEIGRASCRERVCPSV